MRSFFSLSRPKQWVCAVLLSYAAMLPVMLAGGALAVFALESGRGFPWVVGSAGVLLLLYMVLLPLWMPLLQFVTAPLAYLLGHYRYLSPMLLVEKPTLEEYRIHGGTNFDYFVHLRWRDRGPSAARKTLRYYLEGLLALADEVEQGRLPAELRIVGTSYIFTPSTARRLGFTMEEPARGALLGLYLNYLNLLWKHSFARGRLAFPDVHRIRQAATTGGTLVRHRPRIEALLRRLRSE
ncbi:MAG TPA: hypothetical protein VGR37_10595 [Longimicrobiaceae bacterium]|nr:hypothetical protein [Longimicrobiaceae bacterium]